MESNDEDQHIGVEYGDREELLRKITPIIKRAITSKEKIIYVIDRAIKQELRVSLSLEGKEFQRALREGQIEVLESQETYMAGGKFEPEAMCDLVESIVVAAHEDGYAGMCGIGEMSWMFGDVLGTERVVEYESKLSEMKFGLPVRMYCLYDKRDFVPEMLRLMRRIHKVTI